MGHATKLQSIKRKNSEQIYVNIPMQAARMLDLSAGEHVEWSIEDRSTLILERSAPPPSPLKKKRQNQ
jgi:hypothetical protein